MNAVARHLPVSTKPKKPAKKPKQTALSLAVANNVGYDRAPEGITTETWLTPPEIVHGLGPFDLDPCIPQQGMPWRTATRMLKPSDDGLKTPWPKSAFVWMNPPYGGHKNSPTSQHPVLPPGWDPGHELPGGIGVHRLRCCSRAQAQAGSGVWPDSRNLPRHGPREPGGGR